jgi:murein DD-endopeptidase MepM/ murein hydrolase activator NlpD
MLVAVAGLPLAAADDLDDQRDRVQGDISSTQDDLDQSSAEVTTAAAALQDSKRRLAAAEATLASSRGELAAAEALDRQMQARLETARRRLVRARADLTLARSELASQEELLGQIAASNYQTGDPNLLGLSMVLTTQDPSQLTSQLNSMQSVLDKEAVALDRMAASRVVLTVQEDRVEAAKVEVAARRQAAKENLLRKQGLEDQAEAAQARVSDLTALRARAHARAVSVREADLARLQALERERQRIEEMLRVRAEKARAAAAAAAEAAQDAAQADAAAVPSAPDLGTRASSGLLDYPVNTYITSSYGMRLHPVYHRWTLHDGTDFGAACGTPIHAAAAGEVIATYFNAGYGNRIILDNGFQGGVALSTAYNHLSGYAASVGDRVERGEVIGYVGTTGYSTGCHLHFMVFENGATVDPMSWL